MWDFFETVRHRHSVRKYQSDMPVEEAKLHAILEAAIAAPSAGDRQAYKIIAVSDTGLREGLAQAAGGQAFIAQAPVCLVFCTQAERSAQEFGERGRALYCIQDATIAAAYAQLAVVAAGMASTWGGNFDAVAVRDLLSLEQGLEPVALLCIGYPAELPAATGRRHLGDMVERR